MIRSVNIDGEDYLVKSCEECPFYSEALGDEYCSYPKGPHTRSLNSHGPYLEENCPLGLVKDCFSCKHEDEQKDSDYRCENCHVWFHADTGIEDPPTKWEAKE